VLVAEHGKTLKACSVFFKVTRKSYLEVCQTPGEEVISNECESSLPAVCEDCRIGVAPRWPLLTDKRLDASLLFPGKEIQ
jgi:hypothetical protein